jgi:hypothetical protein
MTNPPLRRSLSEQVTHRFGYAASLYLGAEQTCQFGKASIASYGLPTFLLLGFALENAFAAFLMACEHKSPGDYKSHDLTRAMTACKPYGLVFAKDDIEFVERFTPLQKSFAFRYPEQMDEADLGDLTNALRRTRSIITDVQVGLKIKGFDPAEIAENLPDERTGS